MEVTPLPLARSPGIPAAHRRTHSCKPRGAAPPTFRLNQPMGGGGEGAVGERGPLPTTVAASLLNCVAIRARARWPATRGLHAGESVSKVAHAAASRAAPKCCQSEVVTHHWHPGPPAPGATDILTGYYLDTASPDQLSAIPPSPQWGWGWGGSWEGGGVPYPPPPPRTINDVIISPDPRRPPPTRHIPAC